MLTLAEKKPKKQTNQEKKQNKTKQKTEGCFVKTKREMKTSQPNKEKSSWHVAGSDSVHKQIDVERSV